MMSHGAGLSRSENEEGYCLYFLGKHFIEATRGEQELIGRLLDAERRLSRVDEFLEALR